MGLKRHTLNPGSFGLDGGEDCYATAALGLCLIIFLFSTSTGSAGKTVSAEDVKGQAEAARQTAETFMQESFKLRMGYEYSGGFTNQNDRDTLYGLAKNAGNQLGNIIAKQEWQKQQIEDYPGDDWDDRYGSTGLWRKLSSDLYAAVLSKCEIDFYLALSAEQSQKNEILRGILARTDLLESNYDTAYSHFLRARTFAILAQTEPSYKPSATKEFDAIAECSDTKNFIAFRVEVEKIKFFGESRAGQLNMLAEELKQSDYAKDVELVLSLAFLQRRYNTQAFEQTVHLWPQTEDFLGELILSQLSASRPEALQQISVFEAELAAMAAWKDDTSVHKPLLSELAKEEKFQTPLIMYLAAETLTDSSPAEAINLLIKASKLQKAQRSNLLEVPAYEIAEQAAKLSYNLFAEDSNHCPLFLEAFENYSVIAGEKSDEKLEYLHSIVLDKCGQAEKRKELLEKIAVRTGGSMCNAARLELIKLRTAKDDLDEEQNLILSQQLSDLIVDCTGQNEEHTLTEAMAIYCRLPLKIRDKESAQKVLDIYPNASINDNPIVWIFKAKVLSQTGRLQESVDFLLKAFDANYCEDAGVTMELLSEITVQIDQLQAQTDDFGKMIHKYKKLSQFAYGCFGGKDAALFLAETAIFAAEDNNELSETENLLNVTAENSEVDDVDILRCRARLLTRQGNFEEAGKIWAQIGNIRKDQASSSNQQGWEWWRAKYYELYCWSKCADTSKEDVVHTIEILENSYQNIPALWAEKVSLLKQQCTNPSTGPGN